jgi:hypothetical protein
MKPLVCLGLGVVVAGSLSVVASAQNVISAKAGVVHYVEGRVFLNNQLIESKFAEFPDIKENQQLRTEDGRAEVLLTPGVFLRLGENGAIRMITNRLIDTRVELLSGEAVVEADELLKDNGVTIVYKDYVIQIAKQGVYRFDSQTAKLRVYDGEALVQYDGKTEEVKEGHALTMDGGMQVASFDKKKDIDDLYLWGAHRSEYIAMANVSAAKTVADSGSYMGTSGWYFNPDYNMYTFMPGYGYGSGLGYGYGNMFLNPFGYAFWNPYNVYGYIYSLPYYGYGNGYPGYGYGGYGYAPGTGGGAGRHGVHPPTRIPRGITPAAVAMRSVTASSHEIASTGRMGGGGFGRSSGGGFSSAGTSSHSSSSMGMSGGHAGGGGGGGHK